MVRMNRPVATVAITFCNYIVFIKLQYCIVYCIRNSEWANIVSEIHKDTCLVNKVYGFTSHNIVN